MARMKNLVRVEIDKTLINRENQPGVVVSPVEEGDQDDQQKRRNLGGKDDEEEEEEEEVAYQLLGGELLVRDGGEGADD